jgi:hypothetical protein
MLKFTMIVVSVVLYAALAVWGWGSTRAFFSHTALVALIGVLLAVSVVSFFSGGNLNSGIREDRGNRWVLLVFTILGIVDGYLPALTDRKDFWTIDGDATRWIGVAILPSAASYGSGRCSCWATASADWSPSSRDTRW